MASLYVIKGPTPGLRLTIDRAVTLIGRSPECHVVVQSTSVSRQHARILQVQGQYFLEDMKSRNGSRINGVSVRERWPLRENDTIQVCDWAATFHLGEKSLAPVVVGVPEEDTEGDSTSISLEIGGHGSSIIQEIKSAEKLRIILQACNNLRRTLELDQLLPRIADSALQLFREAERCFVFLHDPATGLQIADCRLQNEMPNLQSAICNLQSRAGSGRHNSAVVRECLQSVKPCLASDASRSSLFAPLTDADGRAFGVLQVDGAPKGRSYTADDLELLAGFADQASIAVENGRLHEELLVREQVEIDLEQAAQVQRSILPETAPAPPGYEFFAHYASALQVGGDYYDFVPLPGGRWAAALGDVAGKGMSAALLMAKLSSDMRYCLSSEAEPDAALERLNRLLYPLTSRADRFVTLALAVLDPERHEVALLSAGQLPPLLLHEGTVAAAMPREAAGIPLGMLRDAAYTAVRLPIGPGDCLVLYTDGVTEAVDRAGKQFGEAGLRQVLEAAAPRTPTGLGKAVLAAVERHAGGRDQHDDITLLTLGRRP